MCPLQATSHSLRGNFLCALSFAVYVGQQESKIKMTRTVLFFCLVMATRAEEILKVLPTPTEDAKSGTVSLSGSDISAVMKNAVFIVPFLLLIIFLDFAIFGAYASRNDDLNPVSEFFFHVRRGFNILTQRSGIPQHHNSIYQKYHKKRRHRYQR